MDAGTAPVKAEFLIHAPVKPAPDDDAAEGKTGVRDHGSAETHDQDAGSSRRKSKAEKKAQRGANKGRRFVKIRDDLDLCYKVAGGRICEFGTECKYNHDVETYLASKPPGLRIPTTDDLLTEPPFVRDPPEEVAVICPLFLELGECKHGFKCRFLEHHVKKDESGASALVVDEDRKAHAAIPMTEVNYLSPQTGKALRTKKYPFPVADAYLKSLQGETTSQSSKGNAVVMTEPEQDMDDVQPTTSTNTDYIVSQRTGDVSTTSQLDTPDLQVRFSEKKRLNWKGMTYLAPLTTVGNLPFRRLCVKYGADITCGEMGLSTSFLQGSKEEWSLVRRHPSERTFGVQVAGNKPNSLVPTAEVIAKECSGNIDFVDLNCGCPIDLVVNNGSGSALLDAAGKLGKILIGMNQALGDIPLTVKLRTGMKDNKSVAHSLMPRLAAEWGVSATTLHGRSRMQRYTKLADWDYIQRCVEAVRAREVDNDLTPIPIFGGGDCYSSQDYWSCVEKTGVDGVMIARGALIKPWIFTEVKERREWDISSRERLDHVRQYAEYGLCHFGTDTAGINATRRYLCEALSFQYRYIPIGLLERLPGRLNDRAPAYQGRDELETLLASPDSRDWVKLSEMFLGPAPATWSFTPKHKSNAYESQG